jgi:hypothetical protein
MNEKVLAKLNYHKFRSLHDVFSSYVDSYSHSSKVHLRKFIPHPYPDKLLAFAGSKIKSLFAQTPFPIRDYSTFLDLGCHPGFMSYFLLTRCPEATGLGVTLKCTTPNWALPSVDRFKCLFKDIRHFKVPHKFDLLLLDVYDNDNPLLGPSELLRLLPHAEPNDLILKVVLKAPFNSLVNCLVKICSYFSNYCFIKPGYSKPWNSELYLHAQGYLHDPVPPEASFISQLLLAHCTNASQWLVYMLSHYPDVPVSFVRRLDAFTTPCVKSCRSPPRSSLLALGHTNLNNNN